LAIYHFQIRPLSRAKGANAVGAAAYIARDKLRDERQRRTYDFRRRDGLEHAEIFIPRRQHNSQSQLPTRAELWNRAEQAERQRNSRVAREYQFTLPYELKAEDRIALARRFAQHIADRYGGAVDLAVHRAPAGGDQRNVHAHVLSTTREYHPEGLGRKTVMEINGQERKARGLLSHGGEEYRQIRASWAEYANEALREHGISARIDHRSLAAQGIDRRPQRHLGAAVTAIMRRGGYSHVAERIQAEQAAEQAALLEHNRKLEQTRPTMSLERQRRTALESWRTFREQERSTEAEAHKGRDARATGRERGSSMDRDFER